MAWVTTWKNPQNKMHPSLRYLLLRRLLPAMLVIMAAGAGTAYWIATESTELAYDRSLLNTALAIAEQTRISDGRPVLQLSAQAQTVLLADKFDRSFFAVHDAQGELIAGSDLPMPSGDAWAELIDSGRLYYDAKMGKEAVRVAALQAEHDEVHFTILVGETLVKRHAIVRDILLGMFLPELLLVTATIVLTGIGVRSGLAPLISLRRQLAGRSQADLSPVNIAIPIEMQPLVDEINSLLSRLDRALGSQRHFVSDAAHQLRTPIAALQAQVEIAVRSAPADSRGQLEGVLTATRRLSHLVDQLLALARAEPSQHQPLPTVDLEQLVHETAETWLPQAIAKNIDLGFELASAKISGNNLLLGELLGNLIDNAIRHTPCEGSVTVSCGTSGDAVWLAVEDSGAGIPAAEREHVMKRFYQSPGSDSNGCGLGLTIVDAIARQHGGMVIVDASPQLGGARLTIKLPQALSS